MTDTLVDHNRGGVQCSFCTNLTITGSTIVDNLPRPDGFSGSGVFFMANVVGPSATITGSTIEANRSGEPGGGVRLIADDVMPVATIGSTTIQGNRTVDGNFAKPEGIVVGGDGGGIAQLGGELQVTASTVDGNFVHVRAILDAKVDRLRVDAAAVVEDVATSPASSAAAA